MEEWFHSGAWPQEAQMLHCHESNRRNSSSFLLPWLPPNAISASYDAHGFLPSFTSSKSIEGVSEDRAAAASKSHSQAEKRRRERINAHLTTLRRLIPRSDKMDKAALLGSVVDHVKELKRKAIEIGNVLTIPTEMDQVFVDSTDGNVEDDPTATSNNKDNFLLKASLCCDDRPELLADIIGALKGLKLRTVRAELATLGGRVVNVMILCTDDALQGSVCLNSLKQSLKVALTRIASSSMASSTASFSSKRQRMLLPSHCSHFSV